MGKTRRVRSVSSSQLRADLERLESISRTVGSEGDLGSTLQLIVDRLCESSPWTMANLIVLEEGAQHVRVVAQHGLPSPFVPGASFPVEGSAAYAVMQQNRPFICENCDAEVDYPFVLSASADCGFHSFLAVPLPIDKPKAVLGVFSAERRRYSEDEVAYLEAVAHQAAVAIRNSQLYEREHAMVVELANLSRALRVQNETLERAVADNAELTRLVLEERGLGSIARTLARILGNPVMIEDVYLQLLGFSDPDSRGGEANFPFSTINRLMSASGSDAETKRVLDSIVRNRRTMRVSVSSPAGKEYSSLVAPITAGREIFGYLSVIESNRTLDSVDIMTVDRAATVCALELLKQKAAFEVELRLKADFMTDLLAGNHNREEAVFSRAAFLGFDFWHPSTLLVVDIDDFEAFASGREVEALRVKRSLFHIVDESAMRRSPRRLVVPLSDRIVVLIPFDAESPKERRQAAVRLAEEIQASVEERVKGITVSIGIGSDCPDWTSIRQSHEEATKAIKVMRNLDRRRQVVSYDELGIYGVLFRTEDKAGLLDYPRQVLGPLLDHDRRRRGDLVRTLQTYLEHRCNIQESAARLVIHPNTLRQRLERIRDLTDFDLEDPETLLQLHLAVKIHSLSGSDKPLSSFHGA